MSPDANRDETARKLREVLNAHAQQIEPSPHALFDINRKIRDTDAPAPSKLKALQRLFRPAYLLGAGTMLLIGLFTGLLLARPDSGTTGIQIAAPSKTQPPPSPPPVDCTNDASSQDGVVGDGFVNVYFYCKNNLVARKRSTSSPDVKNALELLLAGPTQAEIELGITSNLVDTQGNLIREVRITDSWAVVDLSRGVANFSQNIQQLNSTVFGFQNIQLLEYHVSGSCIEPCQTYTRQGVRKGTGDRRVVLFREGEVLESSIYSCASPYCEKLSLVSNDFIYRYTGTQTQNPYGTWLEIVAPDGKIGWARGKEISIQIKSTESLDQIALEFLELIQRFVSLSDKEPSDTQLLQTTILSSLKKAASPLGIYVYQISSKTGESLARYHLADPSREESIARISSFLGQGNEFHIAAESTPPAQFAKNLDFTTIGTGNQKINIYFDFRNNYGEIIAISRHSDS